MTEVTQHKTMGAGSNRSILYGVAGLTAISLGGAAISVDEGLSPSLLDALGPDGHLSVPLPMTALQVAMALAAGSRHRKVALAGSGLLTVALAVALVSGFFDGGYADERLSSSARAYQMLLVGGLTSLAGLATTRFVRLRRTRPSR